MTYAVTWGFLLLAIALEVRFQRAEGVVSQLLALLGPGAAGIGFFPIRVPLTVPGQVVFGGDDARVHEIRY